MEPLEMQFAREAYQRYTATTNNLNYQGLPCPAFDDLTDEIKAAWCAAINPLVALDHAATEAMWKLRDIGTHRVPKTTPDECLAVSRKICEGLGLKWENLRGR